MLNWSNRFNICCFLDNNGYTSPYHRYEALLATEALEHVVCPAGAAFPALQQFHNGCRDWLFGHLAYDLYHETAGLPQDALPSSLTDGIAFPDLFFFRPRVVMLLQQHQVSIGGEDFSPEQSRAVYEACRQMPEQVAQQGAGGSPVSAPLGRIDRAAYLEAVKALQEHIHRGDCYEVNFCRENYIPDIRVYPLTLFDKLNRLSPAPFAAYYRLDDKYLLCASPERFLQQQGRAVISQPIKGTARRMRNAAQDEQARAALYESAKERAENVMVVDLVRNDLSHTAAPGSVEVAELFGIYSFAQVHHMISTVKAERAPGASFTDVLRHAFPMGSMTGAPKIKVMQLIAQYEQTRRGLFSGALGYITPEGDVDFNVVIRSILYNAASRYLSFPTGSAITFYSDPEKEWEECLLKAEVMMQVLQA
ncbi:para-aminobenzoate synthetase component 1 [Chitinophaga japonensis]|uniref:Para-aminobenzoate synthetase component 1 n=1 Tax=Chitinophaga japonensis TaxID=104662 RepID=A0A562TCW2_CHIJA|nr:para-aminobenzoate synthetase component 1 [Chitinophaga japonensis]